MALKYIKNKKRMVWRKMSEETIIMDMENGKIHSLDDVASVIWELIDQYQTPQELLKQLKEVYPEESEEILKADLEEFLEELAEKEMILVEEESEE